MAFCALRQSSSQSLSQHFDSKQRKLASRRHLAMQQAGMNVGLRVNYIAYRNAGRSLSKRSRMKNKIQETLGIKRKGVRFPVQLTLSTSQLTVVRPADTRQPSDIEELRKCIPSTSIAPTRICVRVAAAWRFPGCSSSSLRARGANIRSTLI